MKRRFDILWLLLFVGIAPCWGETVYKVSKSQTKVLVQQSKSFAIKKGDEICVRDRATIVGCGQATKVTAKLVLVTITQRSGEIRRGQPVNIKQKFASPSKSKSIAPVFMGNDTVPIIRDPAAGTKAALYDEFVRMTETQGEVTSDQAVYRSDITLGATAGFNHFFPMLNFQFGIAKKFAIGLSPMFFSARVEDTTVNSLGAYANINYYNDILYRGFWTQFGLGAYNFKVTQEANGAVAAVSESSTSLALSVVAGWRFGWQKGWNFGFAGGFQFVTTPNVSLVTLNFKNFQPSIQVDLGLNF